MKQVNCRAGFQSHFKQATVLRKLLRMKEAITSDNMSSVVIFLVQFFSSSIGNQLSLFTAAENG